MTGGGGGFGPPDERDGERARADVRNLHVTAEAARETYGVDVETDVTMQTTSNPALMSTLPLELFEVDGEPSANRHYGKGGTL
jgi:N-methylhydantoinase B